MALLTMASCGAARRSASRRAGPAVSRSSPEVEGYCGSEKCRLGREQSVHQAFDVGDRLHRGNESSVHADCDGREKCNSQNDDEEQLSCRSRAHAGGRVLHRHAAGVKLFVTEVLSSPGRIAGFVTLARLSLEAAAPSCDSGAADMARLCLVLTNRSGAGRPRYHSDAQGPVCCVPLPASRG